MKQESIELWRVQYELNFATRKSLETQRELAYQFITSRIASDFPQIDGKQTLMGDHPVFIAQHATATCCWGCISKWHGIEKGRALDKAEVDSIVSLIMQWIEWQIN